MQWGRLRVTRGHTSPTAPPPAPGVSRCVVPGGGRCRGEGLPHDSGMDVYGSHMFHFAVSLQRREGGNIKIPPTATAVSVLSSPQNLPKTPPFPNPSRGPHPGAGMWL